MCGKCCNCGGTPVTRESGAYKAQNVLLATWNRTKQEWELIRVDVWEWNELFFSLSAAYEETNWGDSLVNLYSSSDLSQIRWERDGLDKSGWELAGKHRLTNTLHIRLGCKTSSAKTVLFRTFFRTTFTRTITLDGPTSFPASLIFPPPCERRWKRGCRRTTAPGFKPFTKSSFCFLCRHVSAAEGHLDVVKFLLLQPGTNINARDKNDFTPLLGKVFKLFPAHVTYSSISRWKFARKECREQFFCCLLLHVSAV